MAVLPDKIAERLAFFEQHLPIWAVDPAAIGISAAQVASLSNFVVAARADFDAAQDARSISRSATVSQNATMGDMTKFGSDLIKTIRSFAQTNNDINVYTTAQIPPPSPPSPLGPPETPTAFKGTLNSVGEIELSWDASRTGGTSFAIERSVGGITGPWTIIGTSEDKDFTDTAVPRAVDSVSYRITASRSGGSSNPTTPLSLYFGNTGSATASGEAGAGGESLTFAA
jgi:hypothetical protein